MSTSPDATRTTRDTVAAFDFDGTLTHRDSVVPFLRRIGGAMPLGARLLSRPHRLLGPAVRRDRDRLRELASFAAFRGRARADIGRHAAEFGQWLLEHRLRPDTVARLGWHRDAGHRVVLVSASYEVYLEHVGRALGVDGVLATRLEADPDGVLTGRLDGPNCRGAEKVVRLRGWLAELGVGRDGVELFAYGDSAGDRELLAFADHPCWVRGALDNVSPAA